MTQWFPIERVNYWDFTVEADEKRRYDEYKEHLQNEINSRIEGIYNRIADFFSIPKKYTLHTIPEVYITDTVAGGGAQHHPGTNSISLPNKYALPFFFGQAKDLRQTHFYPTVGHEVGHAAILAALTQGAIEKYVWTYMRLDRMQDEFFARLAQRLIANDMQIVLKHAEISDFREDDCHRAFVFADKHFKEIEMLRAIERSTFAKNPELLLQYMQ